LIYTFPLDGNLRDYKRNNLRTGSELESTYQTVKKAQENLQKMGITFVWAVIPNTPSIYPESMPRHIRQSATMSRLSQLSQYLTERGINFLDTTNTMLQHKSLGLLYQKTDTHWNELGAYVGYKAIQNFLINFSKSHSQSLAPFEINQFEVRKYTREGGDLAGMLALQDILKEEYIELVPKQKRKAQISRHAENHITSQADAQCPGPSIVIYRDSFGTNLIPFLSEHYCKASYHWTWNVNQAELIKDKPQFLVVISVERYADDALNKAIATIAANELAMKPESSKAN
jgi:hypothetical protein